MRSRATLLGGLLCCTPGSPRRDHHQRRNVGFAVVLTTTESPTDWSRLSELLPLWSTPGRHACAEATTPNSRSSSSRGGAIPAAPADQEDEEEGEEEEGLPFHCGSQLDFHSNINSHSKKPKLVVYTPRGAMGYASQQKFLGLLGSAHVCFRRQQQQQVEQQPTVDGNRHLEENVEDRRPPLQSNTVVSYIGGGLSAAEDVYPKGPNLMFYRLAKLMYADPEVDYFFHHEPDTVSLRPRWLETIVQTLLPPTAPRFWLKGSTPRMPYPTSPRWRLHINGNALVAANDPAFLRFLAKVEKMSGGRMPYDAAIGRALFSGYRALATADAATVFAPPRDNGSQRRRLNTLSVEGDASGGSGGSGGGRGGGGRPTRGREHRGGGGGRRRREIVPAAADFSSSGGKTKEEGAVLVVSEGAPGSSELAHLNVFSDFVVNFGHPIESLQVARSKFPCALLLHANKTHHYH